MPRRRPELIKSRPVSPTAVSPPTVMAFAGFDPAGGEGLRAEITAIVSMGCRTLSVITALTVQGTEEERSVSARSPALMLCQRSPVSSPTSWKFPW